MCVCVCVCVCAVHFPVDRSYIGTHTFTHTRRSYVSTAKSLHVEPASITSRKHLRQRIFKPSLTPDTDPKANTTVRLTSSTMQR